MGWCNPLVAGRLAVSRFGDVPRLSGRVQENEPDSTRIPTSAVVEKERAFVLDFGLVRWRSSTQALCRIIMESASIGAGFRSRADIFGQCCTC